MTSPVRILAAPVLTGAALFAAALAAPSPALAGPTERAVAQCRAELLGRFPAGTIRTHRVIEIGGSSRRPRVTIAVTAERRYRFECVADGDGRIVTASFDPPRGDGQLASGRE